MRRYKNGKISNMTAVLNTATGSKTCEKASTQIIGRPRRVSRSKAKPLNKRLKGKVRLRGRTILLPKTRP